MTAQVIILALTAIKSVWKTGLMCMRTAPRSVTQIRQLTNAQKMEAEFVILGILVEIAIYFVTEMQRIISAMKKGEEHVWQTGITKTVSNSVTAAKEIICVIMKEIAFACCIGTVRTAQNIVTTLPKKTPGVLLTATFFVKVTGLMCMRTVPRSVTQIHQLTNAQKMEAEFVILGILVEIAIYFVTEMQRIISAMKKGEEHVWQTGITKTVSNSVTAAKEIICVIMKEIAFACCIGMV